VSGPSPHYPTTKAAESPVPFGCDPASRVIDRRQGLGEARLEDGVPQTAGWFVVNARDAPWLHNDMRVVCKFGGEGEAHFEDMGVGLYWLQPGKPMTMYHHEAGQEDFLILSGECILIIDGEEHPLRAWDFVHCPPRTAHAIVAAGGEPSLVLAVGARRETGSVRYPAEPAAIRHGAGVTSDAGSPAEAYVGWDAPRPGPPPEIF
jgi:uncharacterized cupin superfamily protein